MKAIKPRNWNPVVGSLLCYLQKSGFTLVSVAGVDVTGTERTQRQQAKARLIKRTFGVVIVLGAMSVLLLYADIVKPISLFG